MGCSTGCNSHSIFTHSSRRETGYASAEENSIGWIGDANAKGGCKECGQPTCFPSAWLTASTHRKVRRNRISSLRAMPTIIPSDWQRPRVNEKCDRLRPPHAGRGAPLLPKVRLESYQGELTNANEKAPRVRTHG